MDKLKENDNTMHKLKKNVNTMDNLKKNDNTMDKRNQETQTGLALCCAHISTTLAKKTVTAEKFMRLLHGGSISWISRL